MDQTNSIIARNEQEVKGLLRQALELASKGYPVFPLKPNSKEPATTNGFRDATTDPEQIKRWWAETPDYNIGIAAPNLLVVDLDAYKPEAQASKEKLFVGFVPSDIPVVATPRGGFHYYMRVDPKWATEWGIGNNVDLLPGIDVKGCGRGYVVAPGSAVDGCSYELVGGWAELPPLAELPFLPDKARQAIEQFRSKKPISPNKNGHGSDLHQESAEAEEALQLLAGRLPELWQVGRRHALALAVAGFLRKHGIPMEATLTLIRQVAEHDEELSDREAAVWDSYNKEAEEVAGLSLLTEGEIAALYPALEAFDRNAKRSREPNTASPLPRPSTWRERLKSIAEIKSSEFPKLEWLVEGVVPARGLVVLAGRPKSGKSWLALDLVLATAAGTTCLGRPGTVRGTSIYLALEDTDARIKERSEVIGLSPDGAFISCSWPAADQGGYEELREMVGELRPKLVVIDTLAAFKSGTAVIRKPQFDIDYEQARKLKDIADRYNCCVVVIAHTRKADADDVFDTVSGTLGLNAVADTIIILQHQRGSDSGKLHVTGRDVADEQYGLVFENGRWLITDMVEQEPETTRDRVLRGLKQWGPIRAKELHGLLEGSGIGFDALRQTLRRLVADGLVRQDEFGNYYVPTGSLTHTTQENRTHRVTLSRCHTVTLSRDNVTRDTRTHAHESWDELHAQRVLEALRRAPATVAKLSEILQLELWQVRRGLTLLANTGVVGCSPEGLWCVVSPDAETATSHDAPASHTQGSQDSHSFTTAYSDPRAGFKNPVNSVNCVSIIAPRTDDPDAAATWTAVARWVLAQLNAAAAPVPLAQLGRNCPVHDAEYPLPLVVGDLCNYGLVVHRKNGFELTDRGRAVVGKYNGLVNHQQGLSNIP
jgi:DNA-binding HxlR family transcriptional regulator